MSRFLFAAPLSALVACVSSHEPTHDYRPGPPLVYRCAAIVPAAVAVPAPFGVILLPSRRLERSRYESTTDGRVHRVAPCTEI